MKRTLLIPALLVLLAGCGAQQPAERVGSSPEDAIESLRKGGYVIFLRHAATDLAQADTDARNLENCATQRNLTEEGRRQARDIGEAFRAREVPVDRVLASPYCRTRHTARLAFGTFEIAPDLKNVSEDTDRKKLVDALRDLLSNPPPEDQNTVLVGHEANLREATGESVAEGGAVVFVPRGDGFEPAATIGPRSWEGFTQQSQNAAAGRFMASPSFPATHAG